MFFLLTGLLPGLHDPKNAVNSVPVLMEAMIDFLMFLAVNCLLFVISTKSLLT